MALRCGCENSGDDGVFGPNHRCSVDPKPPADLPRFIPSWRFVVPETSEGVAADNLQSELNRVEGGLYDPDLQEARIHQVLGPDELED
jgi:hypothetical protein